MTNTIGQEESRFDLVEEIEIDQTESLATQVAEAASQQAVVRATADHPTARKAWERRYALLLLCADTFAGLIATSAAYVIRPVDSTSTLPGPYVGDTVSYPELAILSLFAWLTMLSVSGAYRSKHLSVDERDYRIPVLSALRLLMGVVLGSYVFHADLSRAMVFTFFAALIVGVLLGRSLVNLVLRHTRRRGRARARVLVVGQERSLRAFTDHLLARPDHNWDVVAMCSTGRNHPMKVRGQAIPVLGTPDDLLEVSRDVEADAVVIANPAGFSALSLQQVSWELERRRVELMLAPDAVSIAGPRLKVSALRGLPVIKVSHPQHESLLRSVHFGVSRVLGSILLLLAAPVLAGIALAIRLGSSGPILYRQKRVGYKGEEFEMLKFRSMVPDAEKLLPTLLAFNEHDGALFKMKDDPRVTPVGRLLRKYSLDELPQLINVVKGEMALVGPRPCLSREMTMFGEAEHRRFMVRPGMTGLWQVSGRSDLAWSDAVKTDLYYVDNWTPALDVRILAQTARVVVAGSGC